MYPKTQGALDNAEKPGRVRTIAQSICFYVREHRADRAEWLRNRDRALAEVPSGTRHPLFRGGALGDARYPVSREGSILQRRRSTT